MGLLQNAFAMIAWASITAVVGVLATCLACTANAQASNAPPPPPAVYELWNPVDRSHTVEARCAGETAKIAWQFEDGDVQITGFELDGASVPEEQLATLNLLVDEIDGDVHVLLDCNGRIARVLFRQAQTHGNAQAKRIQIVSDGANVLQVRRVGF